MTNAETRAAREARAGRRLEADRLSRLDPDPPQVDPADPGHYHRGHEHDTCVRGPSREQARATSAGDVHAELAASRAVSPPELSREERQRARAAELAEQARRDAEREPSATERLIAATERLAAAIAKESA